MVKLSKEDIEKFNKFSGVLERRVKWFARGSTGFLGARAPITTNLVLPSLFIAYGGMVTVQKPFDGYSFRSRMVYLMIGLLAATRYYFVNMYKPLFHNHTKKLLIANGILFGYLSFRPTEIFDSENIDVDEKIQRELYKQLDSIQISERKGVRNTPSVNAFNFQQKVNNIPCNEVNNNNEETETQ